MVALWVWAWLAACGSKTQVDNLPVDRAVVSASAEVCDGVDNDLDGVVDEPWLDPDIYPAMGRYVHDEHCGRCDQACRVEEQPNALSVACRLVSDQPLCVAAACAPGFAPAERGGCLPLADVLCLECLDDGDCGRAAGVRCSSLGGEGRCTVPCDVDGDCLVGYGCREGHCWPEGGSCWCREDSGDFAVACTITNSETGQQCLGLAQCRSGQLEECQAYGEICDELDNNCDGLVDEPFRNDLGAYSDLEHCGSCGVNCREQELPEGELTCGGDPFQPRCVLRCEDVEDGLDPGDRVDADLRFDNGCECVVRQVDDPVGPVSHEAHDIDDNCDGADGVVRRSVYVTPDGDDSQPGSPLYPMHTIAAAVAAAQASLDTDHPRPHVFVAAGTYGESLVLPEGVQLHGGYRRDFLAYDPASYQTVLYASADRELAGGAAVLVRDVQDLDTVLEGFVLRGASASEDSPEAYGLVVVDANDRLLLRNLTIYAGHGWAGQHGADGEAGASPSSGAEAGQSPRAARELGNHRCDREDDGNAVAGGTGGQARCDDVNVSGGRGGTAGCPTFANVQPGGRVGGGDGGGRGGSGGTDSQGPIREGPGCDEMICCGLADFTVPLDMAYAADGANGAAGLPGEPGQGCIDGLGSFEGTTWRAGQGQAGGAGGPGGGGGGGGAGGGAELDWFVGRCEFPDGLGGGGGGGGGGGCGGQGGGAGGGGGPSLGVLIAYEAALSPVSPPRLSDLSIIGGDGGSGGRGGAGGDGGEGGAGGAGGSLPHEERTTPPLSGPTAGGHGGAGGEGGSAGGGGGGCGGASLGLLLWLDGRTPDRSDLQEEYRQASAVTLGRAGLGGAGGGGARAGGEGRDGFAQDILVR